MREAIRAVIEQYALVERGGADDGIAYERAVIRAMKQAGVCGRIKRAASHDAWRPDAEIKVGDGFHFVEVKKNSHAQMGGGSVSYSDGVFEAAGSNIEMSQAIADLLNDVNDSSLHNGIDRLLAFLSSRAKQHVGIPVSGFDELRWHKAVTKGMLLPINRTFESDVSVIAQHYARKNTHYIQIGGAGLFRLSEANPANLPVPVLTGKVQLEVRLAKAGKPTAGMRVQARLLSNGASLYSLDDAASIESMLKAMASGSRRRT